MKMDQRSALDVEALFRDEYPQVLRSVEVIVGSRGLAEEITQEAFCKAIERWRRVRLLDSPGAWVQVVALRLAVRHDRRRRRGARLEPAWSAAPMVGPVDIDLERAIAGLPAGQRMCVVLHHLCDLPVDRVAEVMKVSPGTVKTQLHRARSRLATTLELQEEPDHVAR